MKRIVFAALAALFAQAANADCIKASDIWKVTISQAASGQIVYAATFDEHPAATIYKDRAVADAMAEVIAKVMSGRSPVVLTINFGGETYFLPLSRNVESCGG